MSGELTVEMFAAAAVRHDEAIVAEREAAAVKVALAQRGVREGWSKAAIADAMGLTRSRVSQLLRAANEHATATGGER